MKISLLNKIYIFFHIKYCKIFKKRFLKEYLAVYKYKDRIGYFLNVPGLNKKDCIKKVRTVIYNSRFFNGIKAANDIQVIAIENEVI